MLQLAKKVILDPLMKGCMMLDSRILAPHKCAIVTVKKVATYANRIYVNYTPRLTPVYNHQILESRCFLKIR